jgi:hypothetical protein
MKMYGKWRHSFTIAKLGTGGRGVFRFTPHPFSHQGEGRQHTLTRGDGLQSRSARCGEQKDLSTLPGIESRLLGCSVRSLIAGTAQLSYP